MIYKEIKGDLFTTDQNTVLCHCISNDCAMGAGIARKFTEMGVKENLIKDYPARQWRGVGYVMFTSPTDQCQWMVANLVTKEYYYDKPTYQTLWQALMDFKAHYIMSRQLDIFFGSPRKIAMPHIGCGLDKLEWSRVSEIIKSVFKDTNYEVTIYNLL